MDKIMEQLVSLGKKYNMEKVILFGSRARSDYKLHSDYDVAFVKHELPKDIRYKLLEDIDELDTLHKIDVVFVQDMKSNELIVENIRRDGVVLMDKYSSKIENYCKALDRLKEAIVDYNNFNNLTMRDGVIQRFEITAELAWKSMKYLMESEGNLETHGPKSVLKEAFAQRIIEDDLGWLAVIRDRNATSHIYDEETAAQIYHNITGQHVILFDKLKTKLKKY